MKMHCFCVTPETAGINDTNGVLPCYCPCSPDYPCQPVMTAVQGLKIWNDFDNAGNTRPSAITVNLFQNGALFERKMLTVGVGNIPFTFIVPKCDSAGHEFVYTVGEDPVSNYSTTVIGYHITNSLLVV